MVFRNTCATTSVRTGTLTVKLGSCVEWDTTSLALNALQRDEAWVWSWGLDCGGWGFGVGSWA